MRLGLLTDIHEHVEHLRTALHRFQEQRVDQVVLLGDIFEMGERIQETCRLLAEAKAIGVWGNHDVGLCVDPDARTCAKYGDAVIRFTTTLRPRLEFAGCHFSHNEPWLNPDDLFDLWYVDRMPDDQKNVQPIFDAVPHKLMFAGHIHRWLVASPTGVRSWHGSEPINLADNRYYVVIGALRNGQYAILDTDSWDLVPFNEQTM